MIWDIEDIIEHHGVKGMKWGVRKDRRSSASRRRKTRATPKPPPKKPDRAQPSSKKYKKSDASKLSDKDLRERVNRMNMEKQYKDLISKRNPPSSVSRGAKAVASIIGRSGSKAVGKYLANAVFPHLIDRAIARSGGRLPDWNR